MSEPSNDERPKGARATRTWLARVVLLAMVLGAIAFFNSRQVEAFVALGVGPVMRADDGNGLTREKIEVIAFTLITLTNTDAFDDHFYHHREVLDNHFH